MPVFLPFAAVSIWAMNTIVNKMAVVVIAPGAMAFYRWFFAILVLTPFCLPTLWRQRRAVFKLAPRLVVLASLGMVINQSVAYFAAQTTTATNMALIMSLVPMLSLLFSVWFLNQPLTRIAIAGAILSFSGLGYMLTQGQPLALLESGVTVGDGLMLICASAYALYCVLLKRWPMSVSNWVSVYVQALFAVLMLLPVLYAAPSADIVPDAYPLVGFAAVGASVLAPALWLNAIALNGASRTAMYMNLLPVLTAGIAMIWLDEVLTHYHLIGGSLVLIGVGLSQRSTHPTR
ncbi:DMT family transporter [Salinivibrio proteolyticus]|uniref:DMT family transporter n=1 Tax=Salinivibrio proteolyticus TaxID=334715 RepID=UPI00098895BD|nr:DMT family transporter [Salinivibrio proteolyticus]OOF30843.1 EamA family transporter [Salinivibrio proteolyticus]